MRTQGRPTATGGREGRRFDVLLAEGRLGPEAIRALAEALVHRHAEAERAPDLAPGAADHARTLAGQAELLSRSPRSGSTAVLEAVQRARHFLDTSADRLLTRAGAGRILASAQPLQLADVREGEGETALLAPLPSPAAPFADDAVLELAHLAVALRLRGRDDLAERLVSHYAGECEDFDLYPVLDFYEDLCFVERFSAGATWEPAGAGGAPTPRRLGEPLLLITSGPVASGKSSLARALADQLGAARAVADRIRDHLVHGAPGRTLHEAGWADGLSPGFGPHVYAELLRRGELVLATGRSAVLDAGFPTRRERDAARSLARRLGVAFRFVECRVDPDIQRERLLDREREGSDDGAWLEIARRYDERFTAPDELAPAEHVVVDTSGTLEASLAAALEALDRGPTGDAPPTAGQRGTGRRAGREVPASLPRPPGAVTFDCWRTLLIETDWTAAHALRVAALVEAAREAGLAAGPDRARRAFDEAWNEHLRAWQSGVATGAPEIARRALVALGAGGDGSALDALIARWQEASHSGRVRAVEGARDVLESLARAGIPRALVCDTGLTPGRVVRGLLEAQGLLEWLDVCVFSDEVGVPKPDPATFRAALAAFDVVPGAAVHVGDLRRTDVAGARALGMATIRLRAVYDDTDPLPEADAVADSHDEVLHLLGV